ncbi:flagellar basal body protein FliL [Sphingosinicella sp. BN140058]|nr:flagellar basal body protein FliL [Sphingosinicella sp. BN140058]
MGGEGGHESAEASHEPAEAGAYVEVPPMTVNLRSGDGKPRFLKLRFILVAGNPENEEKVTEKLPLILDGFQPFLRELRPEDLAGSAAVFRLKEEMLSRAARVAGPGIVTDVLIQDLIQQ